MVSRRGHSAHSHPDAIIIDHTDRNSLRNVHQRGSDECPDDHPISYDIAIPKRDQYELTHNYPIEHKFADIDSHKNVHALEYPNVYPVIHANVHTDEYENADSDCSTNTEY